MTKYQGPSFYNGRNPSDFNPKRINSHSTEDDISIDKQSWKEKADLFENEHAQKLPDQVTQRKQIEKEFREYLKEKKRMTQQTQRKRSKHYIAPPFEASKVPSPIYGYKQPPKKETEEWDYSALKEQLKKDNYEFLLYEEYETRELADLWEVVLEEESPLDISDKQTALKIKAPKASKRKPRLYRSLSGIIKEDQSGNNVNKNDVPGLFSSRKDLDQS
jgi:hypothetical protein